MIKYEKKTFSNGLRAIAAPMRDTEAVTLWVLFGTGSKYETKNINGVSHFLEHLFFKGTKRRPNPSDVKRDLDRLGAQSNAFTSKEYTGYYVKAAAKHFDIALDIVSDILLEPLFKGEEIEKERGVILQEIAMYEDNPQRQAYEIFESLLYGDQPAGWDVAGTPDTVKNIKKEDILNYRSSHYLTSNAVVAVAGNIDPKEAFKKVGKAFSKMADGVKPAKPAVKESQKNPALKLKKKDVDQTHVRVGVRVFNMYDERRFTLTVLETILGGNWSSLLFEEIREKLGLAYYVRAGSDLSTDSGYLVAGAGVPHNDLLKVVSKMIEIFKRVKTKGVSEKEIKLAKEYLRGSMALAFETTDEVATFLSSQDMFYKKIMTPEEILKKIEKVTKADILKLAKETFVPEGLNLASIGPETREEELNKILKTL